MLRDHCGIQHDGFVLMVANGQEDVRTMSHPSVLMRYESQILPEVSRHKFRTALGLAPALCGKVDQSQPSAMTTAPAAAAVPIPTAAPAINPKRKMSLAAKVNPDDRPARRRRPTQTRAAPAPAPARALVPALAPDPDLDVEDNQVCDSIKYTNVQIGCETAVTDAYTARLQLLQQLACKMVAKAWIKKIQPKKQTTHPYCYGLKKAPPWWPPKVTHKEPDHIKKAGAWDAFSSPPPPLFPFSLFFFFSSFFGLLAGSLSGRRPICGQAAADPLAPGRAHDAPHLAVASRGGRN